VTNKAQWAEKARKWATHARENKPHYEHLELGYNYAMSPLSAAYGLLECEIWRDKIEARRQVFEEYRAALGDQVTSQEEAPGIKSSRWLSALRLSENKKLHQLIDNQEFEIRRVWNPMHQQPLFGQAKAYLNGTADALFEEGVCLPSGKIAAKDFQQMCRWLQNML
jgi:dTDP-4-amino-4,6-dideoxygalactose transaminase